MLPNRMILSGERHVALFPSELGRVQCDTMDNGPVDQRSSSNPVTPAGQLTGQVVYLFAYDIASEMSREPIAELLGQKVTQFQAAVRRAPREQFFYSPQMVVLPPAQRTGPSGPVPVRRAVKLFPVGAVSVAIHVPFAVDRLEDLTDYHDLHLDDRPLEREARELADQVVRELGGTLIRPVEAVRDEEAYTVFCLDTAPVAGGPVEAFSASDWLTANAKAVAGLLNDDDGRLLSPSEVNDTVSHHLTYHHDDLTVVDWDAALVIQPADELGEVLHVMELANVQLAELVAYDLFLDDLLDRSYRDLARPKTGRLTLRRLREIRLDLSRLSDELSNTTKFFGDWHLARIYQRVFGLFHLNDWQRVIDEKLNTLGDLYQLMRQDQVNRWMMALEVSIVLLFVIDLIILLVGLGK